MKISKVIVLSAVGAFLALGSVLSGPNQPEVPTAEDEARNQQKQEKEEVKRQQQQARYFEICTTYDEHGQMSPSVISYTSATLNEIQAAIRNQCPWNAPDFVRWAEVVTAKQGIPVSRILGTGVTLRDITVTPASAPVSFESLTPCDQLDGLTRAGKSVSEFLVAAHRVGDFAKYESAIGATCPWNREQLQVADRIINPPVIVVQPTVVEPSTRSSGAKAWSGRRAPAIVEAPSPREGWCYSANPLDCPRSMNGNPWDNDLPELPRNQPERIAPMPHSTEGFNGIEGDGI